jgi:hypothetical protein
VESMSSSRSEREGKGMEKGTKKRVLIIPFLLLYPNQPT